MSQLGKRALEGELSPTKTPAVEWAQQLASEGYAVVPNVLTEAECDAAVAKIDNYFAQMNVNLNGKKEHPNTHGIIQHLEVGHCQGVWDVRLNPKVQDIFAQMYGTNDLLVSFDGMCYMAPEHRFGPKTWFHMDQAPRRSGRLCIQGYVNLTDSSDSRTGSLLVLPRSHQKFDEFFEEFPHMRVVLVGKDKKETPRGDWVKLESEEQRDFFGVEPVRVHGGRGSMVLWDSRTVHQNIGPDCDADQALPRCVVYTCMQPAHLVKKGDLKKKQEAFEKYRMTTHWPALKVELFQKKWRTYGKPQRAFPIVRDRVTSQRMLELAGKERMTSQPLRKTRPLLAFEH